jgi:cell division septation protein DedD
MSRLALTGWCFGLVLALLWMFLLGLFVGKGITPANINLTEIKKRMVAEGIWPGSGKTVQQEEPSRTTNTKEKIPLNDLEFYEKLAKKKSDTVTAPNLASSAQPSTKSREQQRPSAGSFTIQLASFKDVASAKKFAAGFKDLKPPPTVRQVELPGKGRWYRVQVGQFASRDEATALADRLAKKYQIQVFVVTLGG